MLCHRARERRRPFPFFFHFSDVEESKVEGSRVEGQRVKGDLYCSELYSPWQRGSNENGNGMVRRFFAKGTDFKFDHGVNLLLHASLWLPTERRYAT